MLFDKLWRIGVTIFIGFTVGVLFSHLVRRRGVFVVREAPYTARAEVELPAAPQVGRGAVGEGGAGGWCVLADAQHAIAHCADDREGGGDCWLRGGERCGGSGSAGWGAGLAVTRNGDDGGHPPSSLPPFKGRHRPDHELVK